jgi:hypothetical protein
MAAIQSLEIDAHVNVGIVRPGDKLVIAVSRLPDEDEIAYLQAQIPGVEIVPIMASALVVYRT